MCRKIQRIKTNNEKGVVAEKLEDCAAIQRYLHTLESQEEPHEVQQGEVQNPAPGKEQPVHT